MNCLRKYGSITTDVITKLEQTLEQKKKSPLKSNKEKLTEHLISSCNNSNKANSSTAEEQKDYITKKTIDSTSTIPKEYDTDFKTGETRNVKK